MTAACTCLRDASDRLQSSEQLRRTGPAVVGAMGQRSENDARKLSRHTGIVCRWIWWRLAQVKGPQLGQAGGGVDGSAGEALEQNRAGRVEVGAVVDALPEKLLGRHVLGR